VEDQRALRRGTQRLRPPPPAQGIRRGAAEILSGKYGKTGKLNRLAGMFRFLYPSWYLPDDQDWGKY